ncbi:ribonuclease H-like domain-containing protein [Luteimonas sp. MC1750]|uniref:ribonuclease H-like domain-containing protein n=1 Tax=Luteimonas sp. MC1750 TaxID=2799326 RepID=UPI0018F0889F|nr:ribonuclease H-like domain-containing protein [Luteimonas sp. MC1750]MBJ6983714.1 ribonuclease H-like domain-containing protein [Luteimonas sp. MC1750]QQO06550.1 ribonuclease H-like domain-containing protein [Luteimonas sp. MC1750]
MTALASKLAGLRRQAGAVGEAAAQPRVEAPRAVVGPRAVGPAVPAGMSREATIAQLRTLLKIRAPSIPAAPRSIDRALPGDEIAHGLRYHEQWVPWAAAGDTLPLDGIGQAQVAREHVLAFDTETTGLAGGTGTRAFMIGAADWRGGGLRIRQLCITRLAAEEAMLDAFAGWLQPDTVLLSYNGKSYDRPLLSTRYRLARMADPLPALRHVDLLHPMRRRYRSVWPNCRLATAERELLGVLREDDLPGAEAPGAWLAYLRGGSASKLRRVGLHNAQDLRSLCGLLEALQDKAVEGLQLYGSHRSEIASTEGVDVRGSDANMCGSPADTANTARRQGRRKFPPTGC